MKILFLAAASVGTIGTATTPTAQQFLAKGSMRTG